MTDTILSHTDADELLPMLQAGALTDVQARAVRDHVSSCLVCRREQKHLAQIAAGARINPAGTRAPHPNAANVLGRIDDYEERRRRNLFTRLLRFGREHPVFVLAAQATLIVLAVFLLVSPIERELEFVTLSEGDTLPAGQYVRAVFEPAMADSSVAGFVASMQLTIVHGPTERGVYTLLPTGATGATDYDALANAMRVSDNVLFAEAVTIGGAP